MIDTFYLTGTDKLIYSKKQNKYIITDHAREIIYDGNVWMHKYDVSERFHKYILKEVHKSIKKYDEINEEYYIKEYNWVLIPHKIYNKIYHIRIYFNHKNDLIIKGNRLWNQAKNNIKEYKIIRKGYDEYMHIIKCKECGNVTRILNYNKKIIYCPDCIGSNSIPINSMIEVLIPGSYKNQTLK